MKDCLVAWGARTRSQGLFDRSLKSIVRKHSNGCGNHGEGDVSHGFLEDLESGPHHERLPLKVTFATILILGNSLLVDWTDAGDVGVLDKCSDTGKN